MWNNAQGKPRALGAGLALVLAAAGGFANEERVWGQWLYVPVYSEVPYGDKQQTLNLTATLSIRNLDRLHPLLIKRVDYYNAGGERVRAYLKEPERLKPLAATEFIIRETDRSGGISASFLVEWDSETPVARPMVEAVMVNSTYNQGVAFNSPARILEERR